MDLRAFLYCESSVFAIRFTGVGLREVLRCLEHFLEGFCIVLTEYQLASNHGDPEYISFNDTTCYSMILSGVEEGRPRRELEVLNM